MVAEIRNMVQERIYRENIERRLLEVELLVINFNSNFDSTVRAGFPSSWDQQGNLIP